MARLIWRKDRRKRTERAWICRNEPNPRLRTAHAVGAEFIDENGGGVRLRKPGIRAKE